MRRWGLLLFIQACLAGAAGQAGLAGDEKPLPPPLHVRGGKPVEGGAAPPVPPAASAASAPQGPSPMVPPATSAPKATEAHVAPPGAPHPPAPPAAKGPPPALPPIVPVTELIVDRVGRFTALPVDGDPDTIAIVMTGNPQIKGDKFSVKARTIVAWLDRKNAPGLAVFAQGFQAPAPPKAPGAPAGTEPGKASAAAKSSVVPEAVKGIYAEGAIEIVTGTAGEMSFRGEEAYIDPRAMVGLIVKPRFSSRANIAAVQDPVPVHVRAERARIVAEGLAVFDQAELTTSRASDRVELLVRTLTVEEQGAVTTGETMFLGFQTQGNQRYHGQSIVGRAERLPLFWWPDAAFGGGEEFPVKVRRVSLGSRSSFGTYAFVGIGGKESPDKDHLFDWTVDAGGYTKRGPALAGDVAWRDGGLSGRWVPFVVWDATGNDRTGFDAGPGARWRGAIENRWDFAPSWRFDVEANAFSDRGVNREFFEADAKNHKDRETYARLRWMAGGTGVTLTEGAHLRDFVTETVRDPELGLWSESVPLLPASSRLALDLSTVASAGHLARRFDEDLPDPDYEAWRTDVTTRVYAPFDVGDVRVSPYAGVRSTSYFERTDGGNDLTRTAFEAGARANLQLHRDFDVLGGSWHLDGLRHIVDVDLDLGGRWFDDTAASDVPFFDRVDQETDHTHAGVSVRNRIETRRVLERKSGKDVDRLRVNATLLDVTTRVSWWPDGVGPYGERGTGEAEVRAMGELSPDRLYARGFVVAGLDGPGIRHGSFAVEAYPSSSVELAAGVRYVHDESMAPWLALYGRWAEKWGFRMSGLFDTERNASNRLRASVFRFSEDHLFEVGLTLRNDWKDTGIFVNFAPAIGGVPVTEPFSPRDDVEIGP